MSDINPAPTPNCNRGNEMGWKVGLSRLVPHVPLIGGNGAGDTTATSYREAVGFSAQLGRLAAPGAMYGPAAGSEGGIEGLQEFQTIKYVSQHAD
ncbi:hypothetical protein [Tardiphaga sp. OK246]|jgi:hypothetical protein|uniref:hypothetical protein n=1 Tax=Tardiphaga sp. OK246 TaxID=1855307 RepID=UPI001132690B|nr:hypothetical protein [Tardiphaga sp. OK246]